MIYNNFYGLEIGEKAISSKNIVRSILQWSIYADYELNDRARTITKDMLYDGDIILVKTYNTNVNGEEKSYIYIDETLHRKIGSGTFEKIKGDDVNTFLGNMIGQNYIILRPSVVLDEELKKLETPSVPEKNEKPIEQEKPNEPETPVAPELPEEEIVEEEIGEDNPSEEEKNPPVQSPVIKEESTAKFDMILTIIFFIIIGPVGYYIYKKNKKH